MSIFQSIDREILLSKAKSLKATVDEKSQTLQVYRDKNIIMSATTTTVREKNSQLEVEAQILRSSNADLQAQVNKTQQEYDTFRQKCADHVQVHKDAIDEHTTTSIQLFETQQQHNITKEQHEITQSQLTKAEEKLEQLEEPGDN